MKKKAACEYQKYNNIKVDTVKQRRENQINGFKKSPNRIRPPRLSPGWFDFIEVSCCDITDDPV